MNLKSLLKKILPLKARKVIPKLQRIIKKKQQDFMIFSAEKKHKKALTKVKRKEKIKVAFFAIHSSVWKYELLYKLFKQDKRFEPLVIICPYTRDGKEVMLKEMEAAFELFKRNGYNVIRSYDEEKDEWLDVKKSFNPDIIFFTNPYKLTKDGYYIKNWTNTLTCYAPYGITHTHLQDMQYNLPFHNLLWKYFVETDMHLQMAKTFSKRKGKNCIVTGYPGIDLFFDKSYTPGDPWKIKERKIKRIIWAPHHTIDDNKQFLSYSNFFSLSNSMLDIAKKFDDKIQIAFKPHPLLKNKLYKEPSWGKEKTDDYYNQWNNLVNGQLNQSDYIDLFLTSDAMILDSGSFLNEYLCVNKPSLYIMRDENLTNRFNEFGKAAFNFHYHGHDIKDITDFIKSTVIEGNDTLKDARENFIKTYLRPPGNNSASANIYAFIVNKVIG